jgi:hypothetical protein
MRPPRCHHFRRPSRHSLLLLTAFLLISPWLLPFLVAALQDLIRLAALKQSGR